MARLGRLARDNPHRARKGAIFTADGLAHRQASRIAAESSHLRVFDNRATALNWLRA